MIIKDYHENSKEKQTFDKDLLQEMDFVAAGKMFFVDGKRADICRMKKGP